ncbi:hypothetical protein RRG08_017010 [Elysia crispata]|uniref:Uncharacterized protein n=1 Tax=Elysia crispata TaxID=231223 RepID=A0AAE0XYS8_9GAST|nr:hypothetical protein RRG08_017010 [Elysia crispata]
MSSYCILRRSVHAQQNSQIVRRNFRLSRCLCVSVLAGRIMCLDTLTEMACSEDKTGSRRFPSAPAWISRDERGWVVLTNKEHVWANS